MNAFRINAFLENPNDPRDEYFPASGLREFAAAIDEARQNRLKMLEDRRELPQELAAVVARCIAPAFESWPAATCQRT
jgi:hypothetical protein